MSKRTANLAKTFLTAGAMFALAAGSTATAATLALSSSTPAGGANNSARTGSLLLNFSAALNPATVSTSAVTLSSAAGNQIVTVSASGSRITVSPRAKLSALTSYTLRVSNSVRGSGGEQLSAPLTVSFTTGDASWKSSQLLEAQTTPATSPTVAATGDNLMVAWRQNTGISVNRYVSGTGWSGSESLTLGMTAEEIQSVIDPQGTLHAVWAFAESATARSLKSVRYTPGVGFSLVQDVETLNVGQTLSPSIGVDATGNVVAAWQHTDPANGRGQIFSSRYVPGTGWVPSPRLDTALRSIDPRVMVDAAGNALAVWAQPNTNNTRSQIWSSSYTAGARWARSVAVSSSAPGSITLGAAVNAAGQAVALTSGPEVTGGAAIYAYHYTLGTGWSAAVRARVPANPASEPNVALDAAGNAIAIWKEGAAANEIWSSQYTAGGSWSPPARMAVATQLANNLKIASDRAGNALAIWIDQNNTTYRLMANRYVAGRGWGTAAAIDAVDANKLQSPSIAIDGNGNAVAAWVQGDAVGSIEAARFE